MEMHILAYTYHWDSYSLWSLPRNERRMWVELVVEQKKAEQKQINSSGSSSSSTYKESS